MIEEIKKRLEAGEVVELEIISGSNVLNELYLSDLEKLEVGYVNINEYCLRDGIYIKDDNGHVRNSNFFISKKELKCFRIKEKAKNTADITGNAHKGVTSGVETTQPKEDSPYIEGYPTFDDLADVVVKAYKNRLLDIFLMNDEVITVFNHDATGTKEGINKADTSKYYQFIDFINSLYTETFVIESEEDINKLISGGKTVLKNGEVLEFINNYNGSLWFNHSNYESEVLFPFVALKGATVTQKKI